jgi:hypothetical protein
VSVISKARLMTPSYCLIDLVMGVSAPPMDGLPRGCATLNELLQWRRVLPFSPSLTGEFFSLP